MGNGEMVFYFIFLACGRGEMAALFRFWERARRGIQDTGLKLKTSAWSGGKTASESLISVRAVRLGYEICALETPTDRVPLVASRGSWKRKGRRRTDSIETALHETWSRIGERWGMGTRHERKTQFSLHWATESYSYRRWKDHRIPVGLRGGATRNQHVHDPTLSETSLSSRLVAMRWEG